MADISIINVTDWAPPLVLDKSILELPKIDVKVIFTLPAALEKLAKDVKEKWIKEWKAAFDPKFDAEFWKMSKEQFARIQDACSDIEKKFKARVGDADYPKMVEMANAGIKNAVATWQGMTLKKCEEIGKKAAEAACRITNQVLGLVWQGTKWAVSLLLRAALRLAAGALKVIALPVDLVTGGAVTAGINAAANIASNKIQQYMGASFPTLSNTLNESASEVRALVKGADPHVGKLEELAKTLQLHLEMQSKQFVSYSMSLEAVVKADPKGAKGQQALKTKAELKKLEASNQRIGDTLAAIRKFQSTYIAWKATDAKALIDSATAARGLLDAAGGAVVSAVGQFLAKTA